MYFPSVLIKQNLKIFQGCAHETPAAPTWLARLFTRTHYVAKRTFDLQGSLCAVVIFSYIFPCPSDWLITEIDITRELIEI